MEDEKNVTETKDKEDKKHILEKVDYYPIGTVVLLKGGTKKSMIVSRGVGTQIGEETQLFDYGGCLYPEGIVGPTLSYFNHKDISKVFHLGMESEEDTVLADGINDIIMNSGLKKGNPYDLNMQNLKKYGKKS
ncbi:MAG: DUF4176 domain-containing protein [Clostridium sp.]|nr:DUF4176 domain-containing protein [Clostridium sp.]